MSNEHAAEHHGEEWRQVPSMKPGYEVSNLGRVRSWRTPGRGHDKSLSAAPHSRKCVPDDLGYQRITFWADGKLASRLVHHLVLEAFVGPKPPGQEGLHGDDNPSNNTLSNLSWGTHQQNEDDKVARGRSRPGARNGMAKLSDKQVDLVRASTGTCKAVGTAFGVSAATVSMIRNGQRYAKR